MKKPKLKLVGSDGNAFVIVGKAKKAARRVGWSKAEIEGMMQEARSGDYDHLLQIMMKHFEVS